MTAVATHPAQVEVEGKVVHLHHLDKVFWPQLGLTKGDLVAYYERIAPYLLPHLQGRPLTMRPFPDGAEGRSFYRWQLPESAPGWVHRWPYTVRNGSRTIEMLVIEDRADLLWAVDQACIEMHPWLSRTEHPTSPDRLIFDLDPGPQAGFSACLQVAACLHQVLDSQGLRAYVKTSGKDGLHVLAPVEPRYTFQEARRWVQLIGTAAEATNPGLITLDKSRAGREDKVLIDYSQNALAKSTAAPYSARTTPAATVSMPLTWGEVAKGKVRPEDFTLRTTPARVEKTGDLLAGLLQGQTLPQTH